MNMGLSSYCFEYAVKLAPTIGESLSAGTLVQMYNLFSFIQNQIIESTYAGIKSKKTQMDITMIFEYAILALSLICMSCVKSDNQKEHVEVEEQGREIDLHDKNEMEK